MEEIVGIPAFRDNYIWCLRHGDRAAVVDPGDAAPVIEHLARHRLSLNAIIITHHHADHVGGLEDLLALRAVPVFGPAAEAIPGVDRPLRDGDALHLPALDIDFAVLDVGGHTLGHIAYYGANTLFCGDTLFGGGCGRLFEGTAAQMWRSLTRLAALPAATRVYCGHEYTEANLRFALAVEPDNAALRTRAAEVASLRREGRPTVPSTIGIERETNPFLRAEVPAVAAAARRFAGEAIAGGEAVFAAIRQWKNGF